MDPRNSQNPFARPPSQPSSRPTPPYTLQAPAQRLPPSLTNDPFLPRKIDHDHLRQEPPKSQLTQTPFTITSYAASLPRDALGTATDPTSQLPENGRSWARVQDEREVGYRSRGSEGLSSSSLPPPPPPPPPSSSFKASLHHSNFRRDDIAQPERTRSSPSMYAAQDHAPPPPPPPFSGRAMLPPSPQHNARASLSRIPPPPLPFSSGRDLPIVFTTNRTAGSMSILSMLGSDPGMPPREPITVQRMNATSPTDSYSSPTPQTVAAASPTRSNPSNEFLQQHPSEKRHSSQAPSNRPVRTYSGEIQYRPYATAKASSPDGPIHGPLSALSNSKSSPRSDANAPHESKLQHNRHSSVGGIISRPSSQPNGYVNPLLDTEKRRAEREARRVAVAKQDDENVQQASHDRVPSFEFMSRQAQLERQRRLEQERIEQEKQAAAQNTPRDDRNSGLNYPFLTQSSVFSEPTCSDSRPETESYVSRLAELRSHNKSSVSKEPFSEDALRCMREQRQRDQQSMSQPLSFTQPRSLDNMDERRIHYHPQNTILGQTRQDITGSVDGHNHQNRVDDVVQSHRTMLGLLNDNKRPGRVSPLPQAVQGAQEQKRGPSSDPIIKNEFSRMFAGIGSGVGSTGMNSGTSTPFPPSPKPESERRITFTGSDALARNGSRIGKRARKPRYDEPKGPEIVDVRATTGSVGAKGIKRSKNGTHHHGHVHVHHHGHTHHHHHHHEGQNETSMHRSGSVTTSVSNHRHIHRHHHHADGSVHRNHHSKPPACPQKSAPRIPTTTVNNDEIFESVRNLPRRHLGSILYSPILEPATSSASLTSKLTYTSAPFTIPRYEGKQNCTLTVRIPRFYLSKQERQQICTRRAVWGTDIYSDDSDPLAAAIHAGWIRGDWGSSIDYSMIASHPLDDDANKINPEHQATFTAPPPLPMLPLPGKDLHLTLLILPALEHYTDSISHGIKSRDWGSDHDGMSFRVETMVWVDEKSARGEERGGLGRRKRLKMVTGAVGPAVRLGLGAGRGNVGVVAVAAAG